MSSYSAHDSAPKNDATDGDKLPDGWEVRHGFDPLVNNETDGIQGNGAGDDPDDDGLLNFDEYLNGCDPTNGDTDGDGVDDGDEAAQGSDPADASDNGRPPPPEDILELPFRIYGDWAAWEMTVEGRGPSDRRVFKLSTDAPGGSATAVRKLHKGNSYRLTMSWLGSGTHTDPYWYCWEAKIGGLPTQQAYGNPSSVDTAVRIPGAATTVAGEGWFADNADGLLTSHVHSNGDGSGNVAEGLEAILYVPKIVTETVATSPPNRARKTIGVGEEVVLRVLPEGVIVSLWDRTQGGGDLSYYSGPTTTYTAPSTGDDVTIIASVGGADCSVSFSVIEPTGVLLENKELGPTPYTVQPTWMSMEYQATIYLQPDSVNFYRVLFYESAAEVIKTGYFTQGTHNFSDHPANGPHHMTAIVIPTKGTLAPKLDIIGGYINLTGSTASGDAYWNILWSYEVPDGTPERHLETIRQNHHVETVNGTHRWTLTKDQSGYWFSPNMTAPEAVSQ
jgi:hypothetical protein